MVTFGPPAIEADIVALESKVGADLPKEFRDLYLQFDGVGFSPDQGDTIWWLIPLADIIKFSQRFESQLGDLITKTEGHSLFFGDWYNGDAFGYIKSNDGTCWGGTVHQWDHEMQKLSDTGLLLDEFLNALAEMADSD